MSVGEAGHFRPCFAQSPSSVAWGKRGHEPDACVSSAAEADRAGYRDQVAQLVLHRRRTWKRGSGAGGRVGGSDRQGRHRTRSLTSSNRALRPRRASSRTPPERSPCAEGRRRVRRAERGAASSPRCSHPCGCASGSVMDRRTPARPRESPSPRYLRGRRSGE